MKRRGSRCSALAVFVHTRIADMKRLVLVALVAASGALGCGGGENVNSDDSPPGVATPRPLVFERWSPAQQSSHDVLVAARGSVIVTLNRISRDGGQSWAPLDPRIGQPTRVAIDGATVYAYTSQLGIARWDLASNQVAAVAGAPTYASDRTWRRDRTVGRTMVFHPIENSIAIERAGSWTTGSLPRPAPTECCPFVKDIEANAQVILVVSGWGVHRSTDGGASWQLAAPYSADAGRDLLALSDGRFALVGGATAQLFTADGVAAGTSVTLAMRDDEATVCDDGSIVAAGKVTRDLGATWNPLVTTGAIDIVIERASCGAGSYWVLMRSESWGYRLLRYAALGMPGVAAGNWNATAPQSWASGGPSIVRAADGTFLAGGLAWRSPDAAWTLREMPARTWSSGGMLFGFAAATFYTSTDEGLTWREIAALGLEGATPDAFARTADGTLYVGQFSGASAGGIDTLRADVWKSADQGTTWAIAASSTATRQNNMETGEAHRFVGITADGTWIATDAVSTDAGLTWEPTHAVGDRSMAHLMPDGSLVMQPADLSGEVWRVYADGGMGALLATHAIEADGSAVLAKELRSVAFDAEGYAYVARGTPHVQIWRSTTPLQQPTGVTRAADQR